MARTKQTERKKKVQEEEEVVGAASSNKAKGKKKVDAKTTNVTKKKRKATLNAALARAKSNAHFTRSAGVLHSQKDTATTRTADKGDVLKDDDEDDIMEEEEEEEVLCTKVVKGKTPPPCPEVEIIPPPKTGKFVVKAEKDNRRGTVSQTLTQMHFFVDSNDKKKRKEERKWKVSSYSSVSGL